MGFFLSSQFLSDDDAYDADDFDLDFDADYEFLSDEEFDVFIEDDEYGSDDFNISDADFCIDDIDGFGGFDFSKYVAETDYMDEAP